VLYLVKSIVLIRITIRACFMTGNYDGGLISIVGNVMGMIDFCVVVHDAMLWHPGTMILSRVWPWENHRRFSQWHDRSEYSNSYDSGAVSWQIPAPRCLSGGVTGLVRAGRSYSVSGLGGVSRGEKESNLGHLPRFKINERRSNVRNSGIERGIVRILRTYIE
jgi:hypothetical protein